MGPYANSVVAGHKPGPQVAALPIRWASHRLFVSPSHGLGDGSYYFVFSIRGSPSKGGIDLPKVSAPDPLTRAPRTVPTLSQASATVLHAHELFSKVFSRKQPQKSFRQPFQAIDNMLSGYQFPVLIPVAET